MHCVQCGAELKPFDKFCRGCGQKKVGEEAPNSAALEAPPRPVPLAAARVTERTPSEVRRTGTSLPAVVAVVGILALVAWFAVSPYITLWRFAA